MASVNGAKTKKVKTTKKGKKGKGAVATTHVEAPGIPERHTTEGWALATEFEEGQLTANVNVSLGARIGLADYSDGRCGVSLTIPVAVNSDAIEKGFLFAEEWCQDKVQGMIDHIKDENG